MLPGFSAAYKLGAKFPFANDSECKRLFMLYLALGHASRMVSSESVPGASERPLTHRATARH